MLKKYYIIDWFKLQTCEEDEEDTGGISIHNIGGVFIVIFVGIFLALITLGFEYWYYKNKVPSRVQSAVVKVSEFDKDVKKGFWFIPVGLIKNFLV